MILRYAIVNGCSLLTPLSSCTGRNIGGAISNLFTKKLLCQLEVLGRLYSYLLSSGGQMALSKLKSTWTVSNKIPKINVPTPLLFWQKFIISKGVIILLDSPVLYSVTLYDCSILNFAALEPQ
eukprot:NODE_436_length_8630_cov_0.178877.p4 type:complete len:123 gc:universal NODE_436_length_8630_cov_0.178877:6396-6764(+)